MADLSPCDFCADACPREPEMSPMGRCIALDVDCAAVCRLAAATLARDSGCAPRFCAMCTEICEACGAEECRAVAA